jgi:hypothetical protein
VRGSDTKLSLTALMMAVSSELILLNVSMALCFLASSLLIMSGLSVHECLLATATLLLDLRARGALKLCHGIGPRDKT